MKAKAVIGGHVTRLPPKSIPMASGPLLAPLLASFLVSVLYGK